MWGSRGVVLLDQVLGSSLEVVKNILFVVENALLVPILSVFASTPEIRDGKNSSHILDENQAGNREARGQGDREAAISVEEGGVLSVLNDILHRAKRTSNSRAPRKLERG